MKFCKLAVSVLSSITLSVECCGAEFKPIDFEGYGLEKPDLAFVVGGPSVAKTLDESLMAAKVRFKVPNEEVAKGLSVTIQGLAVESLEMLERRVGDTLLDNIRNPLNYGEGSQEYFSLREPPEFMWAIETTNGDFFVRMYIDESLTYCSFYCQDGKKSTVWKLGPNLKTLIDSLIKKKNEK